ncbi:MAG: AraC family transcriptional regulator [Planctomycetota bacterium]
MRLPETANSWSDRIMKQCLANQNQLWVSPQPGLEAWSSAWLSEHQTRHSHDFFQLSVTRAGTGRISVDGRTTAHSCGSGILIPPGEVHELRPYSGVWEFDTVYFSLGDFLNVGIESRRDVVPYPVLQIPPHRELQALFQTLHRSITRSATSLCQSASLQDLLLWIGNRGRGEEVPDPAPGRITLRRTREYLDAVTERNISSAELADVAGIGECHLNRSFRREFGLPPHAYHLQVRVNRARALLKEHRAVAEVAVQTGFADQAHFTRHFKQLVGVTPGRFLLQVKNIQDGSCREV